MRKLNLDLQSLTAFQYLVACLVPTVQSAVTAIVSSMLHYCFGEARVGWALPNLQSLVMSNPDEWHPIQSSCFVQNRHRAMQVPPLNRKFLEQIYKTKEGKAIRLDCIRSRLARQDNFVDMPCAQIPQPHHLQLPAARVRVSSFRSLFIIVKIQL